MKDHATTRVFQALADPTRQQILARISRERLHVAQLARYFSVSRPAISKHLRILRIAGLVTDEAAGKKRIYRLNPQPLAEVDVWLEQYRRFWSRNLQSLKQHVEKNKGRG